MLGRFSNQVRQDEARLVLVGTRKPNKVLAGSGLGNQGDSIRRLPVDNHQLHKLKLLRQPRNWISGRSHGVCRSHETMLDVRLTLGRYRDGFTSLRN